MLSEILDIISLFATVIVLILVIRSAQEKQRLRRKVFNQNLEIIELKHQLSKRKKEYVFLKGSEPKKQPPDPEPWLKKNQGIYKDYAQDYQDEVSDKSEKN
ncbi:MAG: hypothetical protein QP798_07185 [Staphylococcus simulans]|uniref:hypothetical protein n=1 Tax=Staphylococcus simulans TaxID=1286 RepID=UPI000E6A0E67|nr:hypothetical protein [Staphylococcus simulans]MDK7927087.1 hypothetical protein [Staphylococcus simulans]MDK8315714.1 hypothetical protein [Staphylococcus simulans]RIN44400.1 hypothetical protein BU049_11190 [Staphylococcus simulans]RIN71007.1 hypothetical protein BU017_07630 [Staphylococcus simulans]